MSIEKIVAKSLDTEQADAVLTAFRDQTNNIGVKIVAGEEIDEVGIYALGVMESLVKEKLLEPAFDQTEPNGDIYHVFHLTGFGKRVCRVLSKAIDERSEPLWIKIASNDNPDGPTRWIKIDKFDVVGLENASGIVEQFQMLKPHIPEGHHPINLSRVEPKEIDHEL